MVGCGKDLGYFIKCGNYNPFKNKIMLCSECLKSIQNPQSGLESVKKIESVSEDNVSEIEPYSQSDTFCLKDKIDYEKKRMVGINIEAWSAIQRIEKDVKEFIKILKEDKRTKGKMDWTSISKEHILFPWKNCESKTKTLVKDIYNLILTRHYLEIDKLTGDLG